jgi:hypothetical protein
VALGDPKEQGQVPGLSKRPRLGVLRLIKVREFVDDRLGEADSPESASLLRIRRTASRAVTILLESPDRAVGTIWVTAITPSL